MLLASQSSDAVAANWHEPVGLGARTDLYRIKTEIADRGGHNNS